MVFFGQRLLFHKFLQFPVQEGQADVEFLCRGTAIPAGLFDRFINLKNAVKPHHRLAACLRPPQACYCQHWPSTKYPIAYKSCQWGRLTAFFKFKNNVAAGCCSAGNGFSTLRTFRYLRCYAKNQDRPPTL
jgi:hypothetical protein